jgi:hypothetical protein
MRIDASATAITWLPFAALDRIPVIPLELAVAHYDEPPPDVVPDLDELRRRDAFREANELRAWIKVDGDEIVDHGQTGRSLVGDGPELEAQQVSFAAVELPVIQPEPKSATAGSGSRRPSAAGSASLCPDLLPAGRTSMSAPSRPGRRSSF